MRRGKGRPGRTRWRCDGGATPLSRYQRSEWQSCSVTIRPCVSESGSPSIETMRSTSISGSSGKRTRVGNASIAAHCGPSTGPICPTANSRHCGRSRKISWRFEGSALPFAWLAGERSGTVGRLHQLLENCGLDPQRFFHRAMRRSRQPQECLVRFRHRPDRGHDPATRVWEGNAGICGMTSPELPAIAFQSRANARPLATLSFFVLRSQTESVERTRGRRGRRSRTVPCPSPGTLSRAMPSRRRPGITNVVDRIDGEGRAVRAVDDGINRSASAMRSRRVASKP